MRTALANMDREVKGEYQVLLQAKDMGGHLGGLASTTTINITISDVNDNPPRFAKSKKVSTMTWVRWGQKFNPGTVATPAHITIHPHSRTHAFTTYICVQIYIYII